MFRKLGLTLGVAIAISAAALIPTAASAKSGNGNGHGHGHGHWRGHGLGFYTPTYVDYSDCYTVKRVIDTPFGPRVRRITVCG
jgi:hypothetical protein